MDNFVNKIQVIRKILGMSEKKMANIAGLSIEQLKELECGHLQSSAVMQAIENIMSSLTSEQLIEICRNQNPVSQDSKIWSKKHAQCVKCGNKLLPHLARGLCVRCYDKHIALEHTKHRVARTYGGSSTILTREYLQECYVIEQKSLSDIAKECNCTRQYIHKRMKEFDIPMRDKSHARILAIEAGKVSVERAADNGESRIVKHQHTTIYENFFSEWNEKMAYVLGLIYTDGNLQYRTYNPRQKIPFGRLKFCQKEPELIEKLLVLMDCKTKIFQTTARRYDNNIVAGALYYFDIANQTIYNDLIRLGLSPQKSLIISFPEVPNQCIRHFIRGCWDGDGSIYLDKSSNRFVASYVSGSLKFIEGMMAALKNNGFPQVKVYINKYGKNQSYYFRLLGNNVPMLFHYLYDDVPESQYLKRKYDLFKLSLDHCCPK